jgi:hypothetical protein
VNVKMRVQLQKSTMIYFRKNLGFIPWMIAKALFLVSNTARYLAWSLSAALTRNSNSRGKVAAATAALRFHLFGVDPT